MKKAVLISIIFLLGSNLCQSQGTAEDYKRAEKYLHFNIYNLVKNINLYPNWIDKTSNFWQKTSKANLC